MTKQKFLNILFGMALAAAFLFIAALAIPQGSFDAPRLAEVR